jgi:DNA-binding LacI/PurR family transcriptional regulator
MTPDERPASLLNIPAERSDRLSYKFQRVREQIRRAVLARELAGRLPGERELGKQFAANPKTVNKALGDLCCEGLLVRQIGRGTFVALGGNGDNAARQHRRSFVALVLQENDARSRRLILLDAVAEALQARGHELQVLPAGLPRDRDSLPLSAWPSAGRSTTDGLLCCPEDVLSRPTGHFGDDLIFEAYRRHTPMVVIGACPPSAKLNTVMPDYLGAGFRISEYLFKTGCEHVIAVRAAQAGPETVMVVAGCRAAAARNDRSVAEAPLPEDGAGPSSAISLPAVLRQALTCRTRTSHRSALGLICIGPRALAVVMDYLPKKALGAASSVPITCVTEPGDATAEQAGVTSYDADPAQLAAWAARLLLEARPGQRPVEIIVPGALRIRGNEDEAGGKSEPLRSSTITDLARGRARAAGE